MAAADAVLLGLNWSRLGRALCGALKCDSRDTDLAVSGAKQIGSFSAAGVPVVLSIQTEREDFGATVAGVVARLRVPFILLAPTSRFVDASSLGILKAARAEFFDLGTNVLLMSSGKLQAKKKPEDLFAAFEAGASERASDEVARQLFGLVEKLGTEIVPRKAPIVEVFRLRYVKGMSRSQIATKCGCAPTLITLRLKQIRKKLGRTEEELSLMSSQFEKVEEGLSDPRARNIYRKGAAYGGLGDGAQED